MLMRSGRAAGRLRGAAGAGATKSKQAAKLAKARLSSLGHFLAAESVVGRAAVRGGGGRVREKIFAITWPVICRSNIA